MFIQLFAVFPLVMYIFSQQAQDIVISLNKKWRRGDDNLKKRVKTVVNLLSMAMFMAVAVFIPNISSVIRYVGAICGFFLIFFGPIATHIYVQKREGTLIKTLVVIECLVVLFGVVNVVMQFFM